MVSINHVYYTKGLYGTGILHEREIRYFETDTEVLTLYTMHFTEKDFANFG